MKDRQKNVTFTAYDDELRIIQRTMEHLGVTQSTAVRMLIRRGAEEGASSPFVPTKQET
jgi:antitoxin component of RelBE/YafQ-DinJ toxin-antitoxin module